MHAFCEEDSKAFWRAGTVDGGVAVGVMAAAAITLVVARVAPAALYKSTELGDWLVVGLALAIGLAYLPRFRVARTLRVALVLPVAQIVGLGVVLARWPSISHDRSVAYMTTSIVTRSMALGTVLDIVFACGFAGFVIARRGRREHAHVALQIALANLLLAGLWLPIASRLLARYVTWTFAGAEVTAPWRVLAVTFVPPLGCAIAYAAAATRAPEVVKRLRPAIGAVLAGLLVGGLVVRFGPSADASILYGNLVPTLLAAMIAAVLALLAVAIAAWPRRRRTRDALVGRVSIADRFAGHYTLASWLRGPTPATRAFTLVTPHGAVPVPAGIALDVPLPAMSTLLATGDSVIVVRDGDEIAIDGFVVPPAGHPFRDFAVPQPGPRGLALARTNTPAADVAQVALVTWRPCVAYLAIVLVVALPALAGALVVG